MGGPPAPVRLPREGRDLQNLQPIKTRYAVPVTLQACHTALVDGYVVEGHVPADLIVRLLRERPPVAGLGVPGMPVGSPGMEVAGSPPERYRSSASTGAARRRCSPLDDDGRSEAERARRQDRHHASDRIDRARLLLEPHIVTPLGLGPDKPERLVANDAITG